MEGIVTFEEAVFSLETIKKAAYRFSGICTFDFKVESGIVHCGLKLVNEDEAQDLKELARLFKNEVLDQDLRRLIAEETESHRNVIRNSVPRFLKHGLAR